MEFSLNPSLDMTPIDPPLFYMYEEPALDFGWMAGCSGFNALHQSPFGERLAEVRMRELLADSRWRTRDPALAVLFYVPIWEVVSFKLGACNGTTHSGRMAAARRALARSRYFLGSAKHLRDRKLPGHNHLLATTGCIEDGLKLGERLGPELMMVFRNTIVGRDRAYSPLYPDSGVGRCVVEIPYVSNPHATPGWARASEDATLAPAVGFGRIFTLSPEYSNTSPSQAVAGNTSAEAIPGLAPSSKAPTGIHSRRLLLSFQGSLRPDQLCCKPAQRVRAAVARLNASAPDVSISDVLPDLPRGLFSDGRWQQLYRSQAAVMAESTFCLVPRGDTEVTSRLYTAIAAGCVPVVVADKLSGAFASIVEYRRFWLQVEESTFVADPLGLLSRLRNLLPSDLARRQRLLTRYAPDVIYSWHHSRVAENFLRTATYGCMAQRVDTPELGSVSYPRGEARYGKDRFFALRYGTECTCVKRANSYWWVRSDFEFCREWRGRWPTEVCRCLHCSTLCAGAELGLRANGTAGEVGTED